MMQKYFGTNINNTLPCGWVEEEGCGGMVGGGKKDWGEKKRGE